MISNQERKGITYRQTRQPKPIKFRQYAYHFLSRVITDHKIYYATFWDFYINQSFGRKKALAVV